MRGIALPILFAFALASQPAWAGACVESQPCGDSCIPWDQACRVAARPGSDDDGWQIPWELLNGELARGALFCGVYSMLLVMARQKSIGPREV